MELPLKHRSPATLASWLNRILTGAADHLPLLLELGVRMEQQTRWETGHMTRALQVLHGHLAALDLDSPDRVGLAVQLRLRMTEVAAEAEVFLGGSAANAVALRPVLCAFTQAFRAAERLVDRGAAWLHEMDAGVATGRAGAAGEVSRQAYDQLDARAGQLRQRQALLQDVSNSARNMHLLADNVARSRSALEHALRGPLQRACATLLERVAQPAAGRKALLAACADAQLRVTQAAALLLRLQVSRDRLVREAAALRGRCGRALPADPARRRGLARIVLPEPQETA